MTTMYSMNIISLVEKNILYSRVVERTTTGALSTREGEQGGPAVPPAPAECLPGKVRGSSGNDLPGSLKEDRIGAALARAAHYSGTITTGGSVAETIARFSGHPGAAARIRSFMVPVQKGDSLMNTASQCWKAGKTLGNQGAPSDEKMTAINNAFFSSLVTAGTLFPGTCPHMVTAGNIGLMGTRVINYLCREKPAPPVVTEERAQPFTGTHGGV